MSNLATLQPAPRFTPENARAMALLSAESKRRRIAAEQEQCARPSIEPEIRRIANAMKRLPVASKSHDRLARKLKDLWSLAFPTQGAVKSRSTRREREAIQPVEEIQPTPQPVVVPPAQVKPI
jgi:hypothetical protein